MGDSTYEIELSVDGEALAMITVKARDLDAARQKIRNYITLTRRDPQPVVKKIRIG